MSRIDVYLVEKGLAKSRERAKALIKAEAVSVNGRVCMKPSFDVTETDNISVAKQDLSYVGRGALKLASAFGAFDLNVHGKICADIGASTGGFTQCLLENGAEKVYAIDVGHGQLDEVLCADKRVVNCEGVNARNLTPDFFQIIPSVMSVDVSFISLKLIIEPLTNCLSDNGEIIALIKPQFEAGKKALNKNGIVKDKKDHIRVINELINSFNETGLSVRDIIPSSITGGDGNIEYLAHLEKNADKKTFVLNTADLVNKAFEGFKNKT